MLNGHSDSDGHSSLRMRDPLSEAARWDRETVLQKPSTPTTQRDGPVMEDTYLIDTVTNTLYVCVCIYVIVII